jgi:AraC family transcriptional regulator of adaptative response/methylated-DNA-[protein]-cysteine methyltransferase
MPKPLSKRACVPVSGAILTTLALKSALSIPSAVFSMSKQAPQVCSELASRFGYSPFHLTRMFKAHLGVSPRQYSDAIRKKRFATALSNQQSITHAALDAGYPTPNSLYYTNPLGVSPRHYRNGGSGMHIWYATTSTASGY